MARIPFSVRLPGSGGRLFEDVRSSTLYEGAILDGRTELVVGLLGNPWVVDIRDRWRKTAISIRDYT